MNKSTSTRLGQILLDKGLVTAEQLEIAIKEQQKRRQLLDPFDENLGVNSSLGEILIELGFIDRLQLKRGLNWQMMLRKMAIVMSFCAPLMTVSYGAAAGTNARPAFTTETSASSVAPKATPAFTKTSSSSSSIASSSRSRASSLRSSSSSSSATSSILSSIGKSSASSNAFAAVDTAVPSAPEKITVMLAESSRVFLAWTAATDNVGVMRYKIYRDQVEIDVVSGLENSYVDFNVAAEKSYLYGISAGDEAGNWSPIKSVFVKTAAAPPGQEIKSSSSSSKVSSIASSASSIISSASSAASVSSVASSANSSALPNSSAASVSSRSSAVSSTSVSAPASSVGSSSSAANSSVASLSSSSRSLASSSSRSSAASSSSLSANPNGSAVSGPVSFSWLAPDLRENGIALDITEIGGYEFRYRKSTDNIYTYVTINDAWTNYYNFSWLEGTYIFQIAAFDKNGLYSNFVDLAPH